MLLRPLHGRKHRRVGARWPAEASGELVRVSLPALFIPCTRQPFFFECTIQHVISCVMATFRHDK